MVSTDVSSARLSYDHFEPTIETRVGNVTFSEAHSHIRDSNHRALSKNRDGFKFKKIKK